MRDIFWTVLFPFVMCAIFCVVSRGKTKDKRKACALIMIFAGAVELAAALNLIICDLNGFSLGSSVSGVGGLGLHFMYSGFRGIFGMLTAFAWFVTALFSYGYMKNDPNVIRYDVFNLLTLGATMGIFYAADLFTLFFFFEIMSFTSFAWVAHKQTREALYAAGTYLGIAIAGGMAILMGLFIVYGRLGTLSFDAMYENAVMVMSSGSKADVRWLFVAAGCMFVGFGAKASAFPVHVWLPQSYTEAPAPATALLSAILSKTGIFGILLVTLDVLPMQGSWGVFLLIVGIVTMVFGGIRGVMSSNFKTTLAYSSMSQIGFILTGVGMQSLLAEYLMCMIGMEQAGELLGTVDARYLDSEVIAEITKVFGMAVNGTCLHMLNHLLVKLVLFMVAGVIVKQVGSYELNQVRGFGRKKPFLLVVFLLAAAGVGGIPLLNGYVSKTLLHESIAAYGQWLELVESISAQNVKSAVSATAAMINLVETLFLFSGGLTVAYMTKLFVVLFVEKNSDKKVQETYQAKKDYVSVPSKIAIVICALPIPFIGILPNHVAKPIAEYGLMRFGLSHLIEHQQENIHYYSLENLSGALISITVGVMVYFVVVRFMMLRSISFQRRADGYHDIFPRWLNMEKYVYRAVFYTAVPFLLGIISRILDSVVDLIVILLRRTVYRDRALPYELPEGNRVTHRIGYIMERVRLLYYAVMRKEGYQPKNYEHKLAMKGTDIFENFRIIERSLSFGLFMFCVGLGLTMIYLLMVN
ncbi:MAG: complex I subunit 5 family protein [Lachnospiraceae bacterium]|nr:complex I subunit 5 family protein [Lachnospiraceae bacterium]